MDAVHAEPGKPLVLKSIPIPSIGEDEVLIQVAAAGVNRPDLIQRAGFYPPPPGAPQTLGLEAAGAIVAVGAKVEGLAVGDAVTALLPGGGYAGFARAHMGSCLPIPEGLTLVEAAALPETVLTVWANVFERGGLRAGETFLVHGGASGIGTIAIQLAKAMGATVFATAGDADKMALCERLGATRAINHREEDFQAIVRAAGGADVVLDMVGGPYVQRNLDLLKPDGRLVQIAYLQGARMELDLMGLMLKRLTLTGSTLRARPDAEKARLTAAVKAHVWPLIASGGVRPVIDSVFPLAEAEAAHARMQAGAHAGKIVLTP
jgi:putative PIG3 family NAD(P)H quinone oxidoreductase